MRSEGPSVDINLGHGPSDDISVLEGHRTKTRRFRVLDRHDPSLASYGRPGALVAILTIDRH